VEKHATAAFAVARAAALKNRHRGQHGPADCSIRCHASTNLKDQRLEGGCRACHGGKQDQLQHRTAEATGWTALDLRRETMLSMRLVFDGTVRRGPDGPPGRPGQSSIGHWIARDGRAHALPRTPGLSDARRCGKTWQQRLLPGGAWPAAIRATGVKGRFSSLGPGTGRDGEVTASARRSPDYLRRASCNWKNRSTCFVTRR
jgi:hypothetical protein